MLTGNLKRPADKLFKLVNCLYYSRKCRKRKFLAGSSGECARPHVGETEELGSRAAGGCQVAHLLSLKSNVSSSPGTHSDSPVRWGPRQQNKTWRSRRTQIGKEALIPILVIDDMSVHRENCRVCTRFNKWFYLAKDTGVIIQKPINFHLLAMSNWNLNSKNILFTVAPKPINSGAVN